VKAYFSWITQLGKECGIVQVHSLIFVVKVLEKVEWILKVGFSWTNVWVWLWYVEVVV
jgi:hypothetical protein